MHIFSLLKLRDNAKRARARLIAQIQARPRLAGVALEAGNHDERLGRARPEPCPEARPAGLSISFVAGGGVFFSGRFHISIVLRYFGRLGSHFFLQILQGIFLFCERVLQE